VREQVRWRRENEPQLLSAPPHLHELLAFEQRAHDCRVCLLVIEDDLVEEAVTRPAAALDCDGHRDALRNAVGCEQVACSLDLGKLGHVDCGPLALQAQLADPPLGEGKKRWCER
jgi:hypothetical protein